MSEEVNWENVASDLADELHRLRRLLLGLAEVLPPDYLRYLDTTFETTPSFDPLTGWNESEVVKSDVITELDALWQRLT